MVKKEKPGITDMDLESFKRKFQYQVSYSEAGVVTKRLEDVSITVGRKVATELIDDIPMQP